MISYIQWIQTDEKNSTLLNILDICGSNLTAPDGLITSPNYPEFYPQNEECNFTITTEEKPIKLKFHAFDVGNEEYDFLLLFFGKRNTRRRVFSHILTAKHALLRIHFNNLTRH